MRIFFLALSAYLILVIAVAIPLSSRSSEISSRIPRGICDLSSPVSTGTRRPGELCPRGNSNTNRRQKARKKASARKRNRALRPPRPILSGNGIPRPPKVSRYAARKAFPVGSVVHGLPYETVDQPLLTNQAGIIKDGAKEPHPMIVIGHSNKGNLKVVPISHSPPDPRIPVNHVAPSANLRGNSYMGNMVVVHPTKVTKDSYSRKATYDEVEELRRKLQAMNPKQTWTKW